MMTLRACILRMGYVDGPLSAILQACTLVTLLLCCRVAQHCKRRIMLTGTPLQNDLEELQNLLQFILPDVFSKEDINESADLQVCQSLLLLPFIVAAAVMAASISFWHNGYQTVLVTMLYRGQFYGCMEYIQPGAFIQAVIATTVEASLVDTPAGR